LPPLDGESIALKFLPKLTSSGGRLHSGHSRGQAVHAGTFLRKRTIVMDAELIRDPAEFQRILIHELFHFVWVRLGNPRRRAWQNLIETELNRFAPGELGWSAEWRKQAGKRSGRAWRDYLAESFCDTAAWFYTRQDHGEFTLAKRFRARRARWMTGLAVTSLPL
jgi:hypothetical protein